MANKQPTIEIAGKTYVLGPIPKDEVLKTNALAKKFNALAAEGKLTNTLTEELNAACLQNVANSIQRGNPGVEISAEDIASNLSGAEITEALAAIAAMFLTQQGAIEDVN